MFIVFATIEKRFGVICSCLLSLVARIVMGVPPKQNLVLSALKAPVRGRKAFMTPVTTRSFYAPAARP